MQSSAIFASDGETIQRIHERYMAMHNIGGWKNGEPLTASNFAALIEAAFWASLRADEGRSTRVQLRVLPRGVDALPNLALESPQAVADAEKSIAKLAPAISVQGSIVVTVSDDGITIIGIDTRPQFLSPTSDVIIKASAPGVISVGVGPYQPFAVFSGRDICVMESSSQWSLTWYLQNALRKDGILGTFPERAAASREWLALVDLARMIVAHGHGGILLVVPDENDEWLTSLDYAFKFTKPNTEVRDSSRALATNDKIAWSRYDVSWIASLANVDGAVVISPDVRIYGFGAKIKAKKLPDRFWLSEPPGMHWTEKVSLEEVGGMRHQSSMRFVATHQDAMAIVASQDRSLSIASCNLEGEVLLLRNAQWWT